MNKWLYRAVGAVGVASGALLLSNGVAHAQAANDAKPDLDPQAMRGLVADFFTPMGQHREEFIGGLLGGGSPLGGLTGGGSGGLLSGLTGGLTGGSQGSGLLGGLTGANSPLGGLTGGNGLAGITGTLTGKGDGGPLAGLTSGKGLAGLTGGLTGNPDGGSPLSGITSGLTDTLTGNPDAGSPLSGITSGLTDTLTGNPDAASPSTGAVSPSRRGTAAYSTAQRSIPLDPAMAQQAIVAMSPMVHALIADAVAKQMGITMGAAHEEENLPLVDQLPGVSAIMGPDGPLQDLLVVGNFANGIPLVGEVLTGNLDPTSITDLPAVDQLLNLGLLATGQPDLPIVGDLPFVGQALNSLGNQTMGAANGIGQQNPLGDLLKDPGSRPPGSNNGVVQRPAPAASQIGALGPANATPYGAAPAGALPTGATPSSAMPPGATPSAAAPGVSALNGVPSLLPAATSQTTGATAPSLAWAQPATQAAAQSPIHVGRHRATDRPEVADPELEAAQEPESMPLVGSLAGIAGSAMGGGIGTLPLSTLVRNVPLVSDVPLAGEMTAPLQVMRALPLVGTITGLVPVESDTAA